MQTTGNLSLKKPEGTDLVDIDDLNGNMDILDTVVTGKVDKVTGKQLSTNDYTTAEKTKLTGIATGANNYTHPNHTGDVTSTGDGVTAIAPGVIINTDINAAAGIDASKIGTGTVSNAEFAYLDGVTAAIQTQINSKAPLASPAMTGIPTVPTAANGTNTTQAANAAFVQNAIALLMDSAPGALDTLNELAAAMGDDPNFAATVTNALALKLNSSAYTAADVLAKLLTVDGATSGLDVQYHAGKAAGNLLNQIPVSNNVMSVGLNAEMLGGFHAADLPKQTTAALTYYVRTDGLDTNTGLANTAGAAFKTIAKALSMKPSTLNHMFVISVNAGTYSENVVIQGSDGTGYLDFVAVGVVNVLSITAERCKRIVINGFTATSTGTSFFIYDGGHADVVNCISTVSSAQVGVQISNQSAAIKQCTISNRSVAIQAVTANVEIVNCSGTNNTNAIVPVAATIVTVDGTVPAGGWYGGYKGVINPWGDNTGNSRSRIEMGLSTAQVLPSQTFTKVNFITEYVDILSEFGGAMVFTAKEAGTYLVSVQVGITGGPASVNRGILELWANGGVGKVRLCDTTLTSNYTYSLTGSSSVSLVAGDTLQIMVWADGGKTLSTDTNVTFWRQVRIA